MNAIYCMVYSLSLASVQHGVFAVYPHGGVYCQFCFLLLSNISWYEMFMVWTCHDLLIPFCCGRAFRCLQFWCVMNKDAITSFVDISVQQMPSRHITQVPLKYLTLSSGSGEWLLWAGQDNKERDSLKHQNLGVEQERKENFSATL